MNIMKDMRNNTFLKILLWVIVISFLGAMFTLWGGGMDYESKRGHGLLGREYAVKVGGESLSPDVYRLQYQFYVSRIRSILGDKNSARFLKGSAQRTAYQMADEIIEAQLARSYGLKVSNEEVASAIEKLYSFQDPKTEYPEALSRMGTNAKTYQTFVRYQLLIQKLNSLLADVNFFSDAELKRMYTRENERCKAVIALVPENTFLMKVPKPSDKAVKARYEKEKAQLKTPEKRAIKYVELDLSAAQSKIKISPEQVKAYYTNNLSEFSTRKGERRASHILIKLPPKATPVQVAAARKKADAVYKKIKAGANFAEMAKKYSDDKSNAGRGGDLGWFSRQRMVKVFSDAVFDQAKTVGEVLPPVRSPFGFHIIKLTGIGGQAKPFDEVKAQVRQVMLFREPSYTKAAKKLLSRFRKEVEDAKGDEAVKAAVKKTGAKIETLSVPFARDDTIPGFGRNAALAKAVFNAASGKWAPPVKLGERWVRFKVTRVTPAHPSTFEEVKGTLAKALQKEEAAVMAKNAAISLALASKDSKALKKAARKNGYRVKEAASINVESSLPIVGPNIAIAKRLLAAKPGTLVGPMAVDKGWIVAFVTGHTHVDLAKFEKDKTKYGKTQRRKIAQNFIQDYVSQKRAELEKKNAIFYNMNLINKMGKGGS